jgi:hypothetical protein
LVKRSMLTSRSYTRPLVWLPLLLALPLIGSGGCVPELEDPDGTCEPFADSDLLDCTVDATGDPIAERSGVPQIAAYACTGKARPDDSPTIVEGWPQGRICSKQGKLGATGQTGYCCTEYDTYCAYNPVANCEGERKDGFQCRGAYRPETYNPTIYCDQATEREELKEFCCGPETRMSGSCIATAGCPEHLFAWTCEEPDDRPRSQELLASKSRADTYYMTCSIPKINDNGTQLYCCFTPGIMPPGSTCTNHLAVPDCEEGKFGFGCTGPDTPEDSYPSIKCPDPGVAGISWEGYPATLYCCDFEPRKYTDPL